MYYLLHVKFYLNNIQSSFRQISMSNAAGDASQPVMPIHCVESF